MMTFMRHNLFDALRGASRFMIFVELSVLIIPCDAV